MLESRWPDFVILLKPYEEIFYFYFLSFLSIGCEIFDTTVTVNSLNDLWSGESL